MANLGWVGSSGCCHSSNPVYFPFPTGRCIVQGTDRMPNFSVSEPESQCHLPIEHYTELHRNHLFSLLTNLFSQSWTCLFFSAFRPQRGYRHFGLSVGGMTPDLMLLYPCLCWTFLPWTSRYQTPFCWYFFEVQWGAQVRQARNPSTPNKQAHLQTMGLIHQGSYKQICSKTPHTHFFFSFTDVFLIWIYS